MFEFKFEPDIPLLTVVRTGVWSLDTVRDYEPALRAQLANLRQSGRSTSFIIDIRSSGPQARNVADALRAMITRLGPLHADRAAVVTSSGLAKPQARRVADINAQVFTSMVLARDWVAANVDPANELKDVHDLPSEAEAEGNTVHVQGPAEVDVLLTPTAALETAKRIGEAAVEALSTAPPRSPGRKKLVHGLQSLAAVNRQITRISI